MEYKEFLKSKAIVVPESGITIDKNNINPLLFDFQQDIVLWALKKGKSAIFAGTGLGKTLMQLEWAKHINIHTQKPILIVAPLAVAQQTIREGKKINIDTQFVRNKSQIKDNGIYITNYEMIHQFDPSVFSGIVLDESSILKSFEGKTRKLITEMFLKIPFKLACTATPSPNDFLEIGNHCEFLNIMSRTEMLATFFVHDGGNTSQWRVKRHAVKDFWKWIASWSVMMSNPKELGYNHISFDLPQLNIHKIIADKSNQIYFEADTLLEQRQVRRETLSLRVEKAAEIANNLNEPVLCWCELNDESNELTKKINSSIEICGAHDNEYKTNNLLKFAEGKIKVLVTKPSIAGFGMNFQVCSKMIFVGISHSFESYYQAVRRIWRFGQNKPCDVYIITSEREGAIVKNIERKEKNFTDMLHGIISATQEITSENIKGSKRETENYIPNIDMQIPAWLKSESL